jgi:hypothetical protein
MTPSAVCQGSEAASETRRRESVWEECLWYQSLPDGMKRNLIWRRFASSEAGEDMLEWKVFLLAQYRVHTQ